MGVQASSEDLRRVTRCVGKEGVRLARLSEGGYRIDLKTKFLLIGHPSGWL